MGDGGQAVIFFIHYRPDDGEILGRGYGFEPTPIEGMAVASVEPFAPDPTTQKFNGEAVIDKTAAEQRQARLPKSIEVRQAIWIELERTDRFVLADYPIILQEGKGPITDLRPSALYARACRQGWRDTCGRTEPSAGP